MADKKIKTTYKTIVDDSWDNRTYTYIVPVIESDNRPATRGRINKMFKYFRNKKVHVRYEYNNSIGWHRVIEKTLTYDSFNIRPDGLGEDFNIELIKDGKVLFEQELGIYWEFTGLGKLEMCNSGPYCYFSIRRCGILGFLGF